MRGRLVALFVAVLGAAFANGRPHPEVDCVAAPYTAWSLARAGTFDVGRYPELSPYDQYHVLQVSAGVRVSIRPPGNALTALPFVAPLAAVRERPPSSLAMLQLGKLVGAACVAVAACLFHIVCRRVAPSAAWPATVLFAFGTCLFSVASQALWTHGPAVLWLCTALYLRTGDRPDGAARAIATGLALGLAVLARPTAAFFAAATVAALLLDRRWRASAWITLGGVLPALLLAYYNWHFFGNLTVGGYAADNWTEAPPLWVGLGGLLVAPSRGVFIYSPALILALYGAVRLYRRAEDEPVESVRALLGAWLAAAVASLIFYARWHDWRGGWCFGPRFLCEAMPVACLLFALAYEALRTHTARALACALVASSVAVHVVGVFGHGGHVAWHERHEREDQGRCLFEIEDTQLEAHARSVLRELAKKMR
ncbi:glycosyltransferase family 39 protein [Frigoriglobus tundricola]|uniref:Uncharacterized protein n=1 Tax=Frigoriglobus tundricola TaxID=2774151 RepID=A0A6M5Z005_9BACT|nr:glycosyltransferase family 39 protein [Frigoriglobus tundricola]QJW99717.1 hypothetical protein FTUN_7340 [Frigoriglobus tundricola]